MHETCTNMSECVISISILSVHIISYLDSLKGIRQSFVSCYKQFLHVSDRDSPPPNPP